MDPKAEDCYAFYLYGSGFFAARENTLGLVTSAGIGSRRHFCLTCRVKDACEAAQHERVRDADPEAAEEFQRAVREAVGAGFTELLAEMALAQHGQNPYYTDALDSFKRGHADRGRETRSITAARLDHDVS
jgi:hypothetical protein